MLKQTFFILSVIILAFVGASQALDLGGTVSKIVPARRCDLSVGVFTNVPEVKTFIDTFVKGVYKSNTLRNLFDFTNSSSQEYADFSKNYTKQALLKIGADGQTASTFGEFTAKAIPKIPSLTLPIVSRAIANMAANFLFVDGALNKGNAENLAKALAKSMKDGAKATANDDPKSKFPAVNDSLDSLLKKDGEFKPERAIILYFYEGNEWFIAFYNPCL